MVLTILCFKKPLAGRFLYPCVTIDDSEKDGVGGAFDPDALLFGIHSDAILSGIVFFTPSENQVGRNRNYICTFDKRTCLSVYF